MAQAHSLKLLYSALIIILCFQGSNAKCDLNNLTICTVRTDNIVNGMQELQATITNECACSLSNLYLNSTAGPSSPSCRCRPSVFKKVGDVCVVVHGERIFAKQTINFKYAWYPPFLLSPAAHGY